MTRLTRLTRLSPRREIALVSVTIAAAGLVTVLREPALGLAVLAGAGAGAMLRPTARTVLAVVVALIGAAIVTLGVTRADVVLLVGGVLAVAASAVAATRSAQWPPPRSSSRGTTPTAPGDASARDTWESLDRGEDPTV